MSDFRLKGYRAPEEAIQRAFIEWCEWNQKLGYPELALGFAVPNGGLRPAAISSLGRRYSVEGQKLKALGVKRGVPDWALPVARGGYIGLMIEFKRPGEKPTSEQADYARLAQSHGHKVVVCTSPEAAIAVVQEYLAG
jgi:VRR-NUC domain-containing protein